MTSLEKLKILTPFQKLAKNVGDLGKLMLPKALKSCPIWSLARQTKITFRFSARVMTVAMVTGDLNLILSFSISVFLNFAVIATICYFDRHGDVVSKNE